MIKVENNNEQIGKYLSGLIDQRYPSRRAFCRAYIIATGEEPDNEALTNMSNRISQIIKGKKSIQSYDLLYFADLLGVSCEQILSAGQYCVPTAKRVTNYSIACSKDPVEWESYINRKDKLILNSDEYGKTVIDYALEFGNYELLKYLMDKNYIWFDSRKDNDYVQTFGAGTSIQRRAMGSIDTGLQYKLSTEDELRIKLIALAANQGDLEMLGALRARENPQLYFRAHYLSGNHPDFDSCCNEHMITQIAASGEDVLDYFTDPFEIKDHVKYTDGSKRTHTFVFPYISKLLDLLIATNSHFAQTALKKALKHNTAVYKKLCSLIMAVKNDERFATEYMKDMWINVCTQDLDFYENGNIVIFRAFYSTATTNNQIDGIITNIIHTTKPVSSPTLKHLAKKLNDSYNAIRNLKNNLGEVIK